MKRNSTLVKLTSLLLVFILSIACLQVFASDTSKVLVLPDPAAIAQGKQFELLFNDETAKLYHCFSDLDAAGKKSSMPEIASTASLGYRLENEEDVEAFLAKMEPSNLLLASAELCYFFEKMELETCGLITLASQVFQKVTPLLTKEQFITIMAETQYPELFRTFMLDNFASYYIIPTDTKMDRASYEQVLIDLLHGNTIDEEMKSEIVSYFVSANPNYTDAFEKLVVESSLPKLKMGALKKLVSLNPKKAEPYVVKFYTEFAKNEKPFNKGLISLLSELAQELGKTSIPYSLLVENAEQYFKQQSANKEMDEYRNAYVYALMYLSNTESISIMAENADSFYDDSLILLFMHTNLDVLDKMLQSSSAEEQMMVLKLAEYAIPDELEDLLHNFEAANLVVEQAKQETLNISRNGLSNPTRIFDVTGWAGYRDGVLGNINWHTGIVQREPEDHPDGYRERRYVQASGPGQNSSVVDETFFLDNKTHKGFRTFDEMSSSQRILIKAKAMQCINIPYIISGFTYQLLNIDSGYPSNYKLEPGDITRFRCDGIVEYVHEYYGFRLCGNDVFWDISKPNGYLLHSIGNGCTPRDQSSKFDLSQTYQNSNN